MMRFLVARYLGLGLALMLMSAPGQAAESSDLLSVDQAFQPQITRINHHDLRVTWRIADGYYLYRHALHFSLVGAGDASLSQPSIPDGERHHDAYFGEVQTYRHQLVVSLHSDRPLARDTRVRLRYQGCADAGLCYPPQDRTLSIRHGNAPTADAGPPTDPTDLAAHTLDGPTRGAALTGVRPQANRAKQTNQASPSQTDRLAARLANAPLWLTLGLFILLGLGLAFTPCILPMIPIVAGLIGSRGLAPARAVSLTLAYVVAMALAYAVFGLVAGYFGANLQAALQRPVVLLPFAGLFCLLGAASFGWFDFQLPGAWQSRLSRIGQGQSGLLGAGLLGFASALVAGPCLAPPLAGALLYISTTGNLWTGALALFCLGLGIGLPLIALALFGARILPRAGAWMGEIRVGFGVLLVAVGLWLALRLSGPTVALVAWGGLALLYALYLSTSPRPTLRAIQIVQRLAVVVLAGYAALAGLGLAIGHGRPGAPLSGLASLSSSAGRQTPGEAGDTEFHRVTDQTGLDAALARARQAGQPALVDFYADWCVECIQMQHSVYASDRVRQALADIAAIEVDVTDYTPDQRALLKRYGVFGPPTVLFFDAIGRPVHAARITGATDTDGLLGHLAQARKPQSP